MREGREDDDGTKEVEKRAAVPLLPMRDIIARATILLPRILQQGNGRRAIALIIDTQQKIESEVIAFVDDLIEKMEVGS